MAASQQDALATRQARPAIKIVDKATFVCTPGPLEGEALERARRNMKQREYFHARERHREWLANRNQTDKPC